MFKWLFRKPKLVSVITAPSAEENHFLHGYDLREWEYLGHSDMFFYYDANRDDKFTAHAFFFIKKNDDKIRSFTIKHHHHKNMFDFYNHSWVTTIAAPWRANQTPWYDPVRTTPSKYTKDRMLVQHSHVWNQESNWWVRSTEQEQYNGSMTKQRKNKKAPSKEIVENVVKVDFNAKNNEDA